MSYFWIVKTPENIRHMSFYEFFSASHHNNSHGDAYYCDDVQFRVKHLLNSIWTTL